MDFIPVGDMLKGLQLVIDGQVFFYMMIGVLLGTFVAVSPPGLGTPLMYALLIPFAVQMRPVDGIALLLGMDAVTATGNTFLPVLFGVPGGASGQAAIMDGYPMGQKGEGRRALGAGFTSSMISAVFSVFTFVLLLIMLRPALQYLGSPELLVLVIWGMCMVSVLSGPRPIKGLMAAAFGLLIAAVGFERSTGVVRYAPDLYFTSGLSLTIVALGLFGLPAAIDLAVRRFGVETPSLPVGSGMWRGVKDAFVHWKLVLSTSFLGVWVGFMPGLGGQVADWLAYGFAAQFGKDTKDTFGKGDIRGVIAPDSTNSSTDAGALVPTLLLGVPGTVTKAFFLFALITMGFNPGPEFARDHMDLIFFMLWILLFANLIGGAICLAFCNPLAKLAGLRYGLLVPMIIGFGFIGTYSNRHHLFDLALFIGFGIVGYLMKRFGYPRAPVLLALVLAPLMEKYLFISVQRWGMDWLFRPQVLILLVIVLGTLGYTLWSRREKPPSGGPGAGGSGASDPGDPSGRTLVATGV